MDIKFQPREKADHYGNETSGESLGSYLKFRIRNEAIREIVGAESVLHYIQRQRVKWFANLERMSCNSIPYGKK